MSLQRSSLRHGYPTPLVFCAFAYIQGINLTDFSTKDASHFDCLCRDHDRVARSQTSQSNSPWNSHNCRTWICSHTPTSSWRYALVLVHWLPIPELHHLNERIPVFSHAGKMPHAGDLSPQEFICIGIIPQVKKISTLPEDISRPSALAGLSFCITCLICPCRSKTYSESHHPTLRDCSICFIFNDVLSMQQMSSGPLFNRLGQC